MSLFSLQRLPLVLLVLLLPFAVAGQNLGAGVVALLLFAQVYQRRAGLDLAGAWQRYKVPLMASTLYLLWLIVSTAANPLNPARDDFNAVGGHLNWAFLPFVAALAQPKLESAEWRRLLQLLALATGVLGLFALTQALWGWQLVGVHFAAGDHRAQGLYSHPLSYAYACLVFFPLGCVAVARMPRSPSAWIVAGSLLFGIITSNSRTVQVVAGLVVVWNILSATRGRTRLALLAGGAALTAALLLTPNPVGEKFRGMLEGHDVHTDYPDDRIAFWEVNLNIWKDRPWLGHGENLGTAYRVPYYEAAGLGSFERKYEAHDMYLQLAVNGGLVGLALVLIWFGWHVGVAARLPKGSFTGAAARQTLAAFLVAAITQNAFQDSIVRFAFTVLATAFWLRLAGEKSPA